MGLKNSKIIVFIFFITLTFIIIGKQISKANDEILVVTENWRPYNYIENGNIKGVSTEIVLQVLEKAKISYTIKVYPWARTYSLARSKKNILIYTLIRMPEREKLFAWIGQIGKEEVSSLYKLKTNTKLKLKNLHAAKKYLIGTNLNSMDHLFLKSKGFIRDKNLFIAGEIPVFIKLLFNNRIDLIAMNSATFEKEIINAGYNPEHLENILVLFKTYPYMAFSLKTNQLLINKVKKAYKALVKEGKIPKY